MRNILLIVFLSIGLVACGPLANGQGNGQDVESNDAWFELTVVTASGEHRFTVEIADDNGERSRGLMFRRSLAPDAGMLFLFEETQPLSFWMKNTHVSLDIIYIDQAGHIISIAKNTRPLSERSLPSDGPGIAVLEVVAGTSDRLGFVAGDEVRHPFFEN